MDKSHKNSRKNSASHGGMAYFQNDHWEKDVNAVETAGGRYASEMNGASEYKNSVDKLAEYVRKHRAEH